MADNFLSNDFASNSGGGFDFNLNLGGAGGKSPVTTPSTSQFLEPVGSGVDLTGFGDFNIGGGNQGRGGSPFLSKVFGGEGQQGYLIPGLQTLSGLANAYTGYKALGLAEDQFNFAKNQSNRDFTSQAQTYNTELEDRQRARLSQTGGYDTSTPAGKQAFERDLAAYVQANSIDPQTI